MPLAITVTRSARDAAGWRVFGTIVPSGTYPTLGDPFDLKPLPRWFSNRKPDVVDINGVSGFIYTYDLVNEKLRVFVNTAGGANTALGEHTNATYVAGILADIITFEATWARPGF